MKAIKKALIIIGVLCLLCIVMPSQATIVPMFFSHGKAGAGEAAGNPKQDVKKAERTAAKTRADEAKAERQLRQDTKYADAYEKAGAKVPTDLSRAVEHDRTAVQSFAAQDATEVQAAEALGAEAGVPAAEVTSEIGAESAAAMAAEAEVLAEAEAILELAAL